MHLDSSLLGEFSFIQNVPWGRKAYKGSWALQEGLEERWEHGDGLGDQCCESHRCFCGRGQVFPVCQCSTQHGGWVRSKGRLGGAAALGGLTAYWGVCGGCWVALLPSARMVVISPGKCPQEHGDYPDFVSHPRPCSLCALQVTNLLSEPEGRHMYQAVVNVLGLAYDDLTGEGTHSQLLGEKQCFPLGEGAWLAGPAAARLFPNRSGAEG